MQSCLLRHIYCTHTGYMFPDSQSISRYLEEPKAGPTSRLCSELASRLQCYVTAGYPERLSTEEAEGSKIGANSAILYGPKGEWIGGFRKTNLFRTDLTWAKAGTLLVDTCLRLISYLRRHWLHDIHSALAFEHCQFWHLQRSQCRWAAGMVARRWPLRDCRLLHLAEERLVDPSGCLAGLRRSLHG